MLHRLFGPSKQEIWKQIARDIGGEYIPGGFLSKTGVTYKHGEWQILLDSFSRGNNHHRKSYTRMRVPFINRDGLYFRIYENGLFSNLGKMFGMQDLEIGDRFFDERFVLQANHERKLLLLLKSSEMKHLIQNQPNLRFEIRDNEGWLGPDYPGGVDVLYFECRGILKETTKLKNLFDLFSLTLERLVHIDSAYEDDPGFKLS